MKMEKFIQAIYIKNLQEVSALLVEAPELAQQPVEGNSLGWTFMHLAVSLNLEGLIDLLVQYGLSVDAVDHHGWTAGHLATNNGNLFMVKKLHSVGANLDALTPLHESYLYFACQHNHPRILAYLLPRVRTVDTVTYCGQDILTTVCVKGHLSSLRRLVLSNTFDTPPTKQRQLLQSALSQGWLQIVDFLHSHFNLSEDDLPLIKNHTGANISYYYQLCLILSRKQELTSAFLDGVCDVNTDLTLQLILIRHLFSTEIFKAFSEYKIHLLTILLQKKSYSFLLNYFLNYPDELITLIATLTAAPFNFEQDNLYREFATLAIEEDNIEICRVFMETAKCFLINYKDPHGDSYLHLAAEHGAQDTLFFLINHSQSAVTQYINHQGETVLHMAARCGQEHLIEQLVAHYRMSVTQPDNEGNTPLHLALRHNHLGGARQLIAKGADYHVRNNQGQSALDIAKRQKQDWFVTQLCGEAQEVRQNVPSDTDQTAIDTLVFQGGGVKGLAFYEALMALIRHDVITLSSIRRVGGSSAGAITALLLAIGYDESGLQSILTRLNFRELLDPDLRDEFFKLKHCLSQRNGLECLLGRHLFRLLQTLRSGDFNSIEYEIKKLIINAIAECASGTFVLAFFDPLTRQLGLHAGELGAIKREAKALNERLEPFIEQLKNHKGLFSGDTLRDKFIEWLRAKGLPAHLTFKTLHDKTLGNPAFKDLYVTVYNASEQKTEVFSYETTPDAIVVDAVRCSMSIQVVFQPHKHYVYRDGARLIHPEKQAAQFFDGGSLDNYMLRYFDKRHYVYGSQCSHPMDKLTNRRVIGFRLLTPEVYDYYEHGKTLPRAQEDDVFSFLKQVLHSIISFTKQESDYLLHPDEQARTVHINTHAVSAVDFDLAQEVIDALNRSGREGGEAFCKRFKHSSLVLPAIEAIEHVVPREQDAFFDYCESFARHESASAFLRLMNTLRITFEAIRNKNGDSLYHVAVADGSVGFLNKLYLISQTLNLSNHQNMKPIDCIVSCKSVEDREAVLVFFEQKHHWESKILQEHGALDRTVAAKKRVLLKQAAEQDQHQFSALLYSQAEQDRLLPFLSAGGHQDLSAHKADDLLNYVYILVKKDKRSLLKQLHLSIDQQDSLGYTIVHYLVAQNDRRAIDSVLDYFAFPNMANNDNEFPLDMIMKMQASSGSELRSRQQAMVIYLIPRGFSRCNTQTRLFILGLMSDFNFIDLQLLEVWNQFKANQPSESWELEYRAFKKARNWLEINQKQGCLSGWTIKDALAYYTSLDATSAQAAVEQGRFGQPNKQLGVKSHTDGILYHLLPTAGHGDCALHALLGQWDGEILRASNVESIRRGLKEQITLARRETRAWELIKEGIRAIVYSGHPSQDALGNLVTCYRQCIEAQEIQTSDGWQGFEAAFQANRDLMAYLNEKVGERTDDDFRSKFYYVLAQCDIELRCMMFSVRVDDDTTVNDLFDRCDRASREEFNWDEQLADDVLLAYASYVGQSGSWILPIELEWIASAKDIEVHYFTKNAEGNLVNTGMIYNRGGKTKRSVCLSNGHYERLLTEQEKNDLVGVTVHGDEQATRTQVSVSAGLFSSSAGNVSTGDDRKALEESKSVAQAEDEENIANAKQISMIRETLRDLDQREATQGGQSEQQRQEREKLQRTLYEVEQGRSSVSEPVNNSV